MRLDHLLSKEHVQPIPGSCGLHRVYRGDQCCQAITVLFGIGGAHGWNIDINLARPVISVHPFGVGNGYWSAARFCARCWVLRDRAAPVLGVDWNLWTDGTFGYHGLRTRVLVFLLGMSGAGTARMLRTTQWTRAS